MLRLSRALVALGSAFLLAGLVAGLVNRELLDGDSFARHANAVRQDPAVAAQLGDAIADQLIAKDPDLVAVRPLLQATAGIVVGSAQFGPAFEAAIVPIHDVFTTEDEGQPVVKLADLGAVLAALVQTLSPSAAARLPADLDVELASVADQSFAADTLRWARFCRLIAWLLPGLALACFALALAVRRDRAAALRSIGIGVVSAGATLGVCAFAVSVAIREDAPSTLREAVTVAAWHELDAPVWRAAGVTVLAGFALAAVAAPAVSRRDVPWRERLRAWLVDPAPRPSALLQRGAVLTLVGAAIVLEPLLALRVIATSAGAVIALRGAIEGGAALVALARRRRRKALAAAGAWQWTSGRIAVGCAVAVGFVAGLSIWNATPDSETIAATAAGATGPCNGYPELCYRRYDDVAFPATHNAMSAADQSGWFLAEQPKGVIGQLDDGIRVFLIDSWYGQTTDRAGLVTNIEASYSDALQAARKEFGDEVVDSALRLRNDADLEPVGPVEPYLCHELCELGSTLWEPLMEQVADWMRANPREVVTFFIQDTVSPDDTAKVFKQAGLLPYAYTPTWGEPWPTLGEMITSGKRMVVLMENHGGGAAIPWLLQGFPTWAQDTPFDNASVSDFSCSRLRGNADSPLFLINHWLNNPKKRASGAQTANAASVLGKHLRRCDRQRGMIPNYVAVDFYDYGALFDEVDKLNGLP